MYPMQSLVIIAPIVFIVLMIAFPLIGFFAGWKRAVFWGAGNLLFYIIGLIIWALAGNAIGGAIAPKLQNAISALKDADLTKIATSIVAPVFFIIVMFVGNIVLIINYYTWFKKVAKLRKADKAEAGTPTVKFRMTNGVIGAVALPALLLPTTFAFTQAIFYGTTSTATRASNKMARNLYSGLDNCNEAFKWFSYYKETPKDFNALWAGLSLNDTKVTIILPGQTEAQPMSLTDAISQTFTEGFKNIYNEATADDPSADVVVAKIDELGSSWNSLIDQAGDIMEPLFASENATELVKDMFGLSGDPQKVNHDLFEDVFAENAKFDEFMQKYEDEGEVTIKTLPLSKDGLENVKDVIAQYYQPGDDLSKEEKDKLDERMEELVELLFTVR